MLPDGWRNYHVKELVDIAMGLNDPRCDEWKDARHIGPENIESNNGRIVNVRTCNELNLISGKYYFSNEAIIYSKIRPNLNKVCLPPYEGLCSADMYVIYPKKMVDKSYLYYVFLGDDFKQRAVRMSMRTGMPKINREDLFSITVSLPPLPEQKKIAAILSTWDEAIEGKEQLLANSRRQKKALMQQLLTGKTRLPGFEGEWKNRSLGTIANPQQWPTISSKEFQSHGYPVYGATGFLGYYSEYNHEGVTVCIGCRGSCGGVIIVYGKSYINGNSMCLDNIDEKSCGKIFLYYLLSVSNLQKIISGSAQPQIIRKDVQKFVVCLPPLPEQKAIAAMLTTADGEIEALEKDLTRLRAEKKALMQQLLTGRRRVKVV